MASFFKTRFVPNPDGTDSATAITNVNTAFVHTYVGDDFTGDGTKEYPFKSVFKANQKSGVGYIVFRGVINEYFSTSKTIIGDDVNQQLIYVNYIPTFGWINRLSCDNSRVDSMASIYGIIATNTFNISQIFFSYCLFKYGGVTNSNYRYNITHCTFNQFDSNRINSFPQYYGLNNIIINTFNAINHISQYSLKYCVFSSTTTFKLGNAVVVQPNWTNDSKANVQLLRNAYLTAGMSQASLDLLFLKDSFGNETCRIILEERNGGTSGNIFNNYNNDGSVLDYSLNPSSNNEALYASDLGGYVGCFKPSKRVDNIDWTYPVNVDASGVDTGEQGILLFMKQVAGVQSIEFVPGSGQIWNRIRSLNTLSIPNGIKFNGANCMSDDGSAFGYYFGKHQNLISPIPLSETDALEPNTIYKVCNINKDIYSAIIFNGIQYLPDYFFKTGVDILNFNLLNIGSGTTVRKVLSTPLESVEIIPYDDVNTPSAFPKFSCPLFGNVLMLFHKIGINADLPVTFSEVQNDKIRYYAELPNWAITNADQEFATLATDTVNYYYKTPILKFLRLELNAHFNVDYDQ